MKVAQETYVFKNVWSQDRKILYTDANDRNKIKVRLNHTLMAKSAMLMIGKVCKNSHFLFLNVLLFPEGLNLLGFFNFCFYILGSSERFDSHESLPSFLSICAIAPFIICFDLKFKTMFSKITTSLSYNCISVFNNITANIFFVQFLVSIL